MNQTKILKLLFVFLLIGLSGKLSAQTPLSISEAENGVLQGVVVANSTAGYSGSGYVTGFDNDGDQVTISIDVPESASYKLAIRYSNTSDKSQDVSLNGGFSFPVDFPNQAGFALTMAGTHYMEKGENTITIVKNWGWTEIDRVELHEAVSQSFNITENLVDPQADSSARALYEMLKLQFGHRMISGQTDAYFPELEDVAGKTPLLRVGDFSSYTEGYPYLWSGGGHIIGKDPDGSTEKLINWYNNSGGKALISFQWHWHSPTGGEAGQNNFYTTNTSFDIRQAVIPGTSEYNDIIRDIDDIAAELALFQEAGVPVLWRPLHEAGGGWFWWGAKGPAPCLAMWDIIYERMVNHHGLHNLIWVWSTPEESWYPGNDKVDIIGHDSYPGYFNYGNQKSAFDQLFELTSGEKLIAMTENGPIPDPDACLDQGAPWLYFMSWSDLVTVQNSESHIRQVYASTDVLHMDSENFKTEAEWRSSLYPANWKPGYKDKDGHFLHDFSHAGYHGGGVPLPERTENIVDVTQAPYSADNTGVSDVTAILQQALNDVGASGGGVVYMPAGTYRISPESGENHALTITKSNTILRGAGAGLTFLYNDQANMRQKSVIYVSPAWAGWFSSAGSSTNIRYDLTEATRVIPVESVSGYQAGDKVVVLNTATEAFIAEHGMTGMWSTTAMRGVAHKRIIDSVDVVRKLLILDAPTRYPLKTRDQARVHKAKPHLQECALEDFSIGMLENPETGWGDNDYTIPGTGAYETHFATVLKFEYTENSWVKGISTYKPESNTLDVHLQSNCLLLNMCRHITVDSCDFQKPQYEGGGGNGYMYTLHANDCLIRNSRANHSRHNYDFKYPYCNGNVILNCRAENSRYSSDFHMYLSMSNLFDHTTVNGDWLESVFRPYGDPIHGHSSSQSVFYNTVGENYHPSRSYIVESRQYENGYIIGTSGEAYQVKTDPVSGTQGGYAYDSSPRDFVEGVGLGFDLRPVSLYLDQLDRRIADSISDHNYAITMLAINQGTGEAIEGAEVVVYGESKFADADGMVSFTDVPESFFLEASHNNYSSLALQQYIIYSDTTLLLKMEENSYELSFEVQDKTTLNPIRSVNVSLDEETDQTDSEGKVSFTVYMGSLNYSLQKDSYYDVNGSVEVTLDTLVHLFMERSHADVKFRLREGSTPVNKVWVKLGEDSVLSDGLGLAKFPDLEVNETYNYSTFREGYVDKEGDFYLQTDSTIELSMEKLSNGIGRNGSEESFRIWPNPTEGTLHLSLPDHKVYQVDIFDAKGIKVLETKASGPLSRIKLDAFPAGVYWLKINSASYSKILKL